MPTVRIDLIGPKSAEYKRAVMRAARESITGTCGVGDERVNIRVLESAPEDVDLPDCRTERLTVVEVILYAGRTPEAKAAMVDLLRSKLLVDPGIEPSEVVVFFNDATPVDLHVLPGEAARP